MNTGIPISFDGRLQPLPEARRGTGYRIVFPTHGVIVDGPAGPTAGVPTLSPLRTDSPAPDLPEEWRQIPFPPNRPTYRFPTYRGLLFAGTAPGVETDPEPWEALAGAVGEAVTVFSAFLPPVTLGGLVRLLRLRNGTGIQGGVIESAPVPE